MKYYRIKINSAIGRDMPTDTFAINYKNLEHIENSRSLEIQRRGIKGIKSKSKFKANGRMIATVSTIAIACSLLFSKPAPKSMKTWQSSLQSAISMQSHTNKEVRENNASSKSENADHNKGGLYKLIRAEDIKDAKATLEKREISIFGQELKSMLRYDGMTIYGGLSDRYLSEVLVEARWSSAKLGIPFGFVLSDWLMECGKLSYLSVQNILDNNLSNMGYETQYGFHLYFYNNLHSFAESYVSTLGRAGAKDTSNYYAIVSKMIKANFFVGESPVDYYEKVMGTRVCIEKTIDIEKKIEEIGTRFPVSSNPKKL